MGLYRFILNVAVVLSLLMVRQTVCAQTDGKPAITAQPVDVSTNEGAIVQFEARATGAQPLSYQWQRNRINLPAERFQTLRMDGVTLADSGSRFRCVVSNQFSSVFTREALLTVSPEKVKPTLVSQIPSAGRTVRHLDGVEVLFSEPVSGVDASDLLINGKSATSVEGAGVGPYVFQFPAVTSGTASLAWSMAHGIQDYSKSPNGFAGGSWTVQVNSQFVPPILIINEVLADNVGGLSDEDFSAEDWIEIYNPGDAEVSLGGWSLSDEDKSPGLWSFPDRSMPAKSFLLIFASGKNRRPVNTNSNLHANFKLSAGGEKIELYYPEFPRTLVAALDFPEQRVNHSFGSDPTGQLRYFSTPTPGNANGTSTLNRLHDPPHFSVPGGTFGSPFSVVLSSPSGGTIRYTLDGNLPTESSGTVYSTPVLIEGNKILRAGVFGANALPSSFVTHSYFVGLDQSVRSLPIISLVTATNNFIGSNGIVGIFGGTYGASGAWQALTPLDYHNPSKHGYEWEKPVSVEILYASGQRVSTPAGLRVQGSGYTRPRYKTDSKFSFRLYFRKDYGVGLFEYPFFDSPVEEFDQLVLRAGHNDISNPFIKDELVRRLFSDTGQVSSHGNFVNLFINGVYKGYYNPTERIEGDFCRSWHGGGELWDVIGPYGGAIEGDNITFNSMVNFATNSMTVQVNYEEMSRRLDLTNFVDYLLVNAYGANGDWPHNNWRAARERVPNGIFRYYVWDAEFSFGANPVSHNTFTAQLAQSEEIPRIYQELIKSSEFRMLFADRIQKHFFNGGALVDANISKRFGELKAVMAGVLPNMDNSIPGTWIPQRRGHLTNHFVQAGISAWTNSPAFTRMGGRVPTNFALTMTGSPGTIYYTTNGMDPRIPFSGSVAIGARTYSASTAPRLTQDVVVKARIRSGTTWSALTEARFFVGGLRLPLHITELMYKPSGGEEYEYLELYNAGPVPIDISRFEIQGVGFQFPEGSIIGGNELWVLASDLNPTAFRARYPSAVPVGYFPGSLDDSGERIALVSPLGEIICSLDYQDDDGWPQPKGNGRSIERVLLNGDPDDPAQWGFSGEGLGTPGKWTPRSTPLVRLNELMAENVGSLLHEGTRPDWIEIYNAGSSPADISGWSLSDDGDPLKFIFPPGTLLPAMGYLVVWCDELASTSGIHTGFKLSKSGESVFLYDGEGGRVDAVTFGRQLTDFTSGVVTSPLLRWTLCAPTPGSPNQALAVAPPGNLVVNEVRSNSPPGEDDWIEVFNKHATLPINLQGFYIGTSNAVHQIKNLSFLGAKEFSLFKADEQPGQHHLDFKLSSAGETVFIYDSGGVQTDKVEIPAQNEGATRGRLPDGGSAFSTFTISSSPGASNYLPFDSGILLNEILAWNTGVVKDGADRVADFIELKNTRSTAVSLQGFSLGLSGDNSPRWVVPAGVSIPAGGQLAIWCDPFRPASRTADSILNSGFSLDSRGGRLTLYAANSLISDLIGFGLQAVNTSVGRLAEGWTLLSNPTPNALNSVAAPLGVPSSLRINEFLARPQFGDSWFELFNADAAPLALSGFYLTDDPSLAGQRKFMISPLSFVGPGQAVCFVADGEVEKGLHHVSFGLDGRGETIRIYRSDLALIDVVDFGLQEAGVAEARFPDGSGAFKKTFSPSPGLANVIDTDQDGLPDAWETSNGVSKPEVDDDNDGFTNIEEYWIGSEPKNAASRLVFNSVSLTKGSISPSMNLFPNRRLIVEERGLGDREWKKFLEIDPSTELRNLRFYDGSTATRENRIFRLRVAPMK